MNKIAKFEKVSYEQFKKDFLDCVKKDISENTIKDIYDRIKLPKRATKGSAGYDFYAPHMFSIGVNDSVKIPTGIRCNMDNGWVLSIYPRSGHGFKYGVHLANTVCIVDADYYGADNEGHIFVKLINDSVTSKNIDIAMGDGFCQGIFLPFGITHDDKSDGVRTGGFGSTDK